MADHLRKFNYTDKRSLHNLILYTLYFANDQILIAEDKDDLSYMVTKLLQAYEQRGLITKKKKTEYTIVVIMRKRIYH
jgi:hypothetical protein